MVVGPILPKLYKNKDTSAKYTVARRFSLNYEGTHLWDIKGIPWISSNFHFTKELHAFHLCKIQKNCLLFICADIQKNCMLFICAEKIVRKYKRIACFSFVRKNTQTFDPQSCSENMPLGPASQGLAAIKLNLLVE